MKKKNYSSSLDLGVDLSNEIKKYLDNFPFLIIIGKYDHVLGPRALFSPIEFANEHFIKNLLRDALNTKNKFVILNYNELYSQISKVEIKDSEARGQKQLYAIIILRHIELPLIPTIHLKRMEMLFRKIGEKNVLKDNHQIFKDYFNRIQDIYINKNEIVPLESVQLKIRSGVNTIKGFCELILEQKKVKDKISEDTILNYVELMLDSCDDIIEALEKDLYSSLTG
jgi:hypothetical protein